MRLKLIAIILLVGIVTPGEAGQNTMFRQPEIVPPYDTCSQDALAIATQATDAQDASTKMYGDGLAGITDGLAKACSIVRQGIFVMNRANCQSDSNYAQIIRLRQLYRDRSASIKRQAGKSVYCD